MDIITGGTPETKRVYVRLAGEDGNAFLIMGRVRRALREAGIPDEEIERYTREASSGEYDHLLQVTFDWITEGDPPDEAEEED